MRQKNLTDERPTFKNVIFLRKYKEKQFLCGYKTLAEFVFVTLLISNERICLTNCVGYDKLLFHKR
jgi:hypothetical protein